MAQRAGVPGNGGADLEERVRASQLRLGRNLDRFCRNIAHFREGRPLEGLIDKALAYNRDYVAPTLKRRKPGFNESFYGFRSFSDLLEEARARGDMELELDEKSGGYIIRSVGGD